jgi:hypothetical protein
MEETEIGEVGVDKQAEAAHEKAQEEKHRAPWLRGLAVSSACFAAIAAMHILFAERHMIGSDFIIETTISEFDACN